MTVVANHPDIPIPQNSALLEFVDSIPSEARCILVTLVKITFINHELVHQPPEGSRARKEVNARGVMGVPAAPLGMGRQFLSRQIQLKK